MGDSAVDHGADSATVGGTDEPSPGDGGSGADGDVGGLGGDTLDVAVQALGGLTDAVEELSLLEGDALRERATEVASDLRAAAELLLDHTGPDSEEEGEGTGDGEAGGEGAGDGTALFDDIRSKLDRVTELLAGHRQDETKVADKPVAGTTPAPSPEPLDTELVARLQSVSDKLEQLTGAVSKQAGRLARLEKRTGVPQNRPAGERGPAKKSDDEELESWPFDLNAPEGPAANAGS